MSFVLVVEDDADIREDLVEVLREEGFAVEAAHDGHSALRLLDGRADCGLVLLDLMMPGASGWEFRRRQIAAPTLTAIPVVLITGADDLDERSRDLAAAGALQKPFSIDDLVAIVSRYVARSA